MSNEVRKPSAVIAGTETSRTDNFPDSTDPSLATDAVTALVEHGAFGESSIDGLLVMPGTPTGERATQHLELGEHLGVTPGVARSLARGGATCGSLGPPATPHVGSGVTRSAVSQFRLTKGN